MYPVNILQPQHLTGEKEVVSRALGNQRGLRKACSLFPSVVVCFLHQIFSLSSEAEPVMLCCLNA